MQDELPVVARILIGLCILSKGICDLLPLYPPSSCLPFLFLSRDAKSPYKLCRFRLAANFFDKKGERDRKKEGVQASNNGKTKIAFSLFFFFLNSLFKVPIIDLIVVCHNRAEFKGLTVFNPIVL